MTTHTHTLIPPLLPSSSDCSHTQRSIKKRKKGVEFADYNGHQYSTDQRLAIRRVTTVYTEPLDPDKEGDVIVGKRAGCVHVTVRIGYQGGALGGLKPLPQGDVLISPKATVRDVLKAYERQFTTTLQGMSSSTVRVFDGMDTDPIECARGVDTKISYFTPSEPEKIVFVKVHILEVMKAGAEPIE